MTFGEAWEALALGERVRVSNELPEPPVAGTRAWNIWRSHNFEGALAEKIDGPPRAMRFDLDPTEIAQISYTVAEAVPHNFESMESSNG